MRRRHRAVEDHVIFMNGSMVSSIANRWIPDPASAKPGVLSRPRVFTRNVDIVVLGIARM